MKIGSVSTELFRAVGQTDRHDECNSRFSQFCEKPLKMIIFRSPKWKQWSNLSEGL